MEWNYQIKPWFVDVIARIHCDILPVIQQDADVIHPRKLETFIRFMKLIPMIWTYFEFWNCGQRFQSGSKLTIG